MTIERSLSAGVLWPLAPTVLPTLLQAVEEQGIELSVRLDTGNPDAVPITTTLKRTYEPFALHLQGRAGSTALPLEAIALARVTVRPDGWASRFGIELVERGQGSIVTILGPAPGAGLANEIWQWLLTAMLPKPLKGLRI